MAEQRWWMEKHTPYAGLSLAVTEQHVDRHSDFQHIEVFETLEYGRMLALDGCVMLTDRDEFVYHEMIVHPALLTHPRPERVAIIGGGDGGSVREVLRHESVQQVDLVEIDGEVIETCRTWFPKLTEKLDDPRVRIHTRDGFDFLDERPATYDAILVDSIDPVGEAAKLFTRSFYTKVKEALREGGSAVFQTESPFYNGEVQVAVKQKLDGLFPYAAPFVAFIPTYPSGLWSFTFASLAIDPHAAALQRHPAFLDELQYFTPEMLRAAFTLPAYMRRRLEAGE